ncbi:MAG: Amuc_1100 family pilus-like protein [Verrucomicrobia bacterium]|nr:Amuc_1100 family pilus-like protein [Verrucomicrobiota bacterium]
MNELVKSPSFYLVRALRVKNEKDKGPAREENPTAATAGGDAAAATTPTPAAAAASRAPGVPEPALPERQTLRYVVGQEQLDVAMRVESVRFAAPQNAKP